MNRPRCAARVARNFADHACTNSATDEQRQSRPVCAAHARQYDRWKADPTRDERSIAEFWWGWKDVKI